MQFRHIEPDHVWGLEPCEGPVPSIDTCVSAREVDTRRTPPGSGAASSRSNVADHSLLFYGRQFWRNKEKYYVEENASSAAAPSPNCSMEVAFQSHCLSGPTGGLFDQILRSRVSATSEIARGVTNV